MGEVRKEQGVVAPTILKLAPKRDELKDVKPLMEKHLGHLSVPVYVYSTYRPGVQAALSVSRSVAVVGRGNERGQSGYLPLFTLPHCGPFAISTITACRPETTRAIRSYWTSSGLSAFEW